jgi:hypothetical protein
MINFNDFLSQIIPAESKPEISYIPSTQKKRWVIINNQIFYTKKIKFLSSKKIEKFLYVLNKNLTEFDGLLKSIENNDLNLLNKLKIAVNINVDNYKKNHSGFFGKIYLLFSRLIYGDIDQLKNKVVDKITLLEQRYSAQEIDRKVYKESKKQLLPLIVDINQIFNDEDNKLCNEIKKRTAPGKQILSWELVYRHAKSIQRTEDLTKIGYEKFEIALINGRILYGYKGDNYLLCHSVQETKNVLKIIQTAPEKELISNKSDFLLNSTSKLCISHYEPGYSYYGEDLFLSCVLSVMPQAIIDVAPRDINTPLMMQIENSKTYLKYREKANILSQYINEIIRQSHSLLDREKAPEKDSRSHLVGLTDLGMIGEFDVLIERYKNISLEEQNEHGKAIFGKSFEGSMIDLLQQLRGSMEKEIEILFLQQKTLSLFNNILYKLVALKEVAHLYGPSELSKAKPLLGSPVKNYSEINVLSTQNQKQDCKPLVEVVAIGISQSKFITTDKGLKCTIPDFEEVLCAAADKGFPIIIL